MPDEVNPDKNSVSVVIPVYNRSASLAYSIESALTQSHSPKEVIVVDDGSTDDSLAIAQSYGRQVRAIHQENQGASIARNRGIDEASGEWIAFLDSDDRWLPSKLKKQIDAALLFPDAGLVFTDTITTKNGKHSSQSRFELGGLIDVANPLGDNLFRCERAFFSRLLTSSRVITSTVMVRRDLLNLRFPENIWGAEDWALWLSLILDVDFLAINEVLVVMEDASDRITGRPNYGKLMRNDVLVLENLLSEPRLSEFEVNALKDTLVAKRTGAAYHSLMNGDKREARRLLMSSVELNFSVQKRMIYSCLSLLPTPLLQCMGAIRRSKV